MFLMRLKIRIIKKSTALLNGYFVVIETVPEKFEIKEVQLRGHYHKSSYIRSGLNDNDKVVVKNQLSIYSELKDE